MRITNIPGSFVTIHYNIEDDDDGKLIFHPAGMEIWIFHSLSFFSDYFRRSFPRLNPTGILQPSPVYTEFANPVKMDITEQPRFCDQLRGSGCIQRTSVKCKTVVIICLFVHTHNIRLSPLWMKEKKRGDYNRFFLAVVSNGVECIIGPCLLLGLSAADWREKKEKKKAQVLIPFEQRIEEWADAQPKETTNITGRFSSAENHNGTKHSIYFPPLWSPD